MGLCYEHMFKTRKKTGNYYMNEIFNCYEHMFKTLKKTHRRAFILSKTDFGIKLKKKKKQSFYFFENFQF